MFEQWNGSRPRFFQPLAARAVASMAVVFAGAAATYALSYYRNIRRIVEEPDLAPAPRRGRVAGWMCSIAAHCFRHPLDRAVLLFVARTMARSRQHRNLLAVFGGLALALALTSRPCRTTAVQELRVALEAFSELLRLR